MSTYIHHQLHTAGRYLITFFKWLAVASVIGGGCGLVGTAFTKSIGLAASFYTEHPQIIWLLPVGGIAISGLYTLTGQHGNGTSTVIDAVLKNGKVPALLAPAIFVSTVITHMLGGSAGREGAALQIGGAIGSFCGDTIHLKPSDRHIAILCGMAAVFTALFGTPVGAALFVLEIADVGALCYSAMVPCFIAAASAYSVTHLFKLQATRFAVAMPALSLTLMVKVSILAVLCGLLSVAVCGVFHSTEHLMAHIFKSRMLRAAVGGAVIIALTAVLGTTDYNGAGEPIFRRALEQGQCEPAAFALKLLFTAVTLGAGFRGGEVVPTFFIGATFGCLVGPFIGLPAGFAAAIGLAATFCGATNCPLATLMLSAELFGGARLEAFAAACAISYLFSGYASLYPNQIFLYSKVDAELWHGEEEQEK